MACQCLSAREARRGSPCHWPDNGNLTLKATDDSLLEIKTRTSTARLFRNIAEKHANKSSVKACLYVQQRLSNTVSIYLFIHVFIYYQIEVFISNTIKYEFGFAHGCSYDLSVIIISLRFGITGLSGSFYCSNDFQYSVFWVDWCLSQACNEPKIDFFWEETCSFGGPICYNLQAIWNTVRHQINY